MQKLSSELVKRILSAGLTQSELANLLQISRIQDSSGHVRGVSYKYTCEILKKCNQTFYNAKNGLIEKGFIRVYKDKTMHLDMDIFILYNNFSNQDFSKGYIDLQMKIFDDEDFYKLSANEMALALDLLRMKYNDATVRQGKPTKEFIEKYKKTFHVTERTIRRYLHNLKTYFIITCFNHKYFFKLKEKWKKNTKEPGYLPEEEKYRRHIAEAACKRARVINQTEEVIDDLKELLPQYSRIAMEACKDISMLVINAVAESIARANELVPKPKWDYTVSVPYVHTILRESLNLI